MTLLFHAFLITVGIGLGWCLILAALLIVMEMAVRGQQNAIDAAVREGLKQYEIVRMSRTWDK